MYGHTLRPRGAVNEIDTLVAEVGKSLVPAVDKRYIATGLVSSAGYEHHAATVGYSAVGAFEPFDKWNTVIVSHEISTLSHIEHSCNLMRLRVGHFVGRPEILAVAYLSNSRQRCEDER